MLPSKDRPVFSVNLLDDDKPYPLIVPRMIRIRLPRPFTGAGSRELSDYRLRRRNMGDAKLNTPTPSSINMPGSGTFTLPSPRMFGQASVPTRGGPDRGDLPVGGVDLIQLRSALVHPVHLLVSRSYQIS